MKAIAAVLPLVLAIGPAAALDIENAKRINRSCALCHGNYGQGTPGTMSPRLAGLPAGYLAKELRFYRDGVRRYPPMVIASSVDSMTDKDIDDISEYLAGVNLRTLNLPEIPAYTKGDAERGEDYFMDECKGCHRTTGLGKPEKDIPPLAGQYGSYLFNQMKRFQEKDRHHDNDPEDETFDGLEDEALDDLVTFLTTLPAHGPLDKVEPFSLQAESPPESEMTDAMIALGTGGTTAAAQATGGALKATKIAGRFKVLPTGDILLTPINQDMRPVTGLSGDFEVTEDGLLFIPR
ncbi:MAG: cytochrome c [Thiocapsa sp.]|uniref:c-type cytochrome n=1 Tax=Thiocapsa sp. TaxID=2024551 RepID=UPI001BCDDAAA|nr:c-type cytochrome [Thiocapsa sp.]QVL49931.1 MAG: cytochrome c [Thiocapsa sp.]